MGRRVGDMWYVTHVAGDLHVTPESVNNFEGILSVYKHMYREAKRYLLEHETRIQDSPDDMVYKMLQETNPMISRLREGGQPYWSAVFGVVWQELHKETPKIEHAQDRIILPLSAWKIDKPHHIRLEYPVPDKVSGIIRGEWEGSKSDVWQSMWCLPGNLCAITRRYNAMRESEFDFRVVCYIAKNCNTFEDLLNWHEKLMGREKFLKMWRRRMK